MKKMKYRRLIKTVVVLIVWGLGAPLAFLLRLRWGIGSYINLMLAYSAASLICKGVVLSITRIQRRSWYTFEIWDLIALARSVGIVTLILMALSFVLQPGVPRSIPIIDGMVSMLILIGLYGAVMIVLDWWKSQRVSDKNTRRVLIVGAGETGMMITREMLHHRSTGLVPIGFLDDDEQKQADRYFGLPILGPIDYLPTVVRAYHIDEVLIAIPSAPGEFIRQVVQLAQEARVKYRTIPALNELLTGYVSVSHLREVKVEDLLRRKPVRLSLNGLGNYLRDKVVLVTGAGGSIGSEIVRQLAPYHPKLLVLVGRGENNLYSIENEIRQNFPTLNTLTFIADIQNWDKVTYIFNKTKPYTVFHAAAHKHVHLMEMNPDEAILNNVGGTKNLLEAALKYNVRRFVNISTDKAVDPTSVMGATKRIAESLTQWAGQQAGPGQAFVSVRFGNVLGSRGSVIPLFKSQIEKGGPVTVTHPDMTRYFMTIPEATQLVLEAAGMGDNGAVYVLDMGEPVKIVDIAHDLIRLSGLVPEVDVDIIYTGIRPGERLSEHLLTEAEASTATKQGSIYISHQCTLPPDDSFNGLIEALFEAARSRDELRIKQALQTLVPNYECQFNQNNLVNEQVAQ
jgi:FlaA1/EpsC-like NDP-sugar epimerase